jgi:NTP pyrophosphatase (non-canonical NTP hydrolase)
MNRDSYQAMLEAVQAFHDKHDLKARGGEELTHRTALMTEELGEIAACVTKGKGSAELAEECADLLILLLGTAISADFDLNGAFWKKMEKLESRQARLINGTIRVSNFKDL